MSQSGDDRPSPERASHGGARRGAGRKRVLTESQEIAIAAEFERRLRIKRSEQLQLRKDSYFDSHAGLQTEVSDSIRGMQSLPRNPELRLLVARYINDPSKEVEDSELSRFEDLLSADEIIDAIADGRSVKSWGSPDRKHRAKNRRYSPRNTRPKTGLVELRREVAAWASREFGFPVTPRRVEAVVKSFRRDVIGPIKEADHHLNSARNGKSD